MIHEHTDMQTGKQGDIVPTFCSKSIVFLYSMREDAGRFSNTLSMISTRRSSSESVWASSHQGMTGLAAELLLSLNSSSPATIIRKSKRKGEEIRDSKWWIEGAIVATNHPQLGQHCLRQPHRRCSRCWTQKRNLRPFRHSASSSKLTSRAFQLHCRLAMEYLFSSKVNMEVSLMLCNSYNDTCITFQLR